MGQYEVVLDFLQRFIRNKSHNLKAKNIAIWGAGNYGRLACCALAEFGISVECFIDSDCKKAGSSLFGLPVRAPETVLDDGGTSYFIVVAVASDDEIRERLISAHYSNDLYLMMCSEMKAEQDKKTAAMPINRLRSEYSRVSEEIPHHPPLLGKRYISNGIHIVPLDGLQSRALDKLTAWLSFGDDDSARHRVSCLCGSDDYLVLAEKDRYGIPIDTVICKECGLVFQNPRISADGFRTFNAEFFADLNFPGDAQPPEALFFWRKKDASPLIHSAIKEYLKPDSVILEIGCAAGSVVEYFSDLGHEAVGIDLDERYVGYGRSRNLELYCCDCESLLPHNEARFDIIVLEHVLEHLVDIPQEVSAVKRLLKPGGYIYIAVPGIKGFSLEYYCFDFLNSLQLMHLYYWTRDTFLQTMGWFGLHAIECDEYISAVMQVGEEVPVDRKTNFSNDVLQFLLHLEKHRTSLQKGIYEVKQHSH